MKKLAFGAAQGDIVIGIDFYAELLRYLAQLKTNPNNITGLEDVKYIQGNGYLETYSEKSTLQFEGLLGALNHLTSWRAAL